VTIITERPARRQASLSAAVDDLLADVAVEPDAATLAALTAVVLRSTSPSARVRAEVARRWHAAGGRPVELGQVGLARTCNCSVRTVERVFAELRAVVVDGVRLFVEAAGRRLAPRLTDAGAWESSPKRWSFSLPAVWAALGFRPRSPDDPTRRPRPAPIGGRRRVAPGRTDPPSPSGPIRNDGLTIALPSVNPGDIGPTAAGRALIAAIRTVHRW
jgi:hypothetical protein